MTTSDERPYGIGRNGNLHRFNPNTGWSLCRGATITHGELVTVYHAAYHLLSSNGSLCDRCFTHIPYDIRTQITQLKVRYA